MRSVELQFVVFSRATGCRQCGMENRDIFAVRNQKAGVGNQEIYDLKFVINKQQSAGMTDGLL